MTAIRAAGLDIDQVAEIAGVDLGTAQPWLSGCIRHPRHCHQLTQALHVSEEQLWPDTRRTRSTARLAEIVAAYPRRSDPDAPRWRALLTAAERQVDLTGCSLSQITHTAEYTQLLTDKATAGSQIRIATAGPDSDVVRITDRKNRPPGPLVKRSQATHGQLLELTDPPRSRCANTKWPRATRSSRFDDTILLTIHLHATPDSKPRSSTSAASTTTGCSISSPNTSKTSGRPRHPSPQARLRAGARRDTFLEDLDNPYARHIADPRSAEGTQSRARGAAIEHGRSITAPGVRARDTAVSSAGPQPDPVPQLPRAP